MEEITIDDLLGTWLGNEYNLIIGHHLNPLFASLVNITDNSIVETSNLQLSEVTPDNTKMLIFNEEYSIEIWGWYANEMTLTINDSRYNVVLRP